ncbi:unnamed protein product, partial [Menidia menidia]
MAASCVRVDPPFVEFRDVKVGKVYRTSVTVTNIGKTSRKIIIEKPARKLFKFTTLSRDATVASGLYVWGMLEFTPKVEEEVRDFIQILIDDVETIQVPVLGLPRVCSLVMDSAVDFGCVIASSQVISKRHPITNQGSAPGVFQVEHSSGDSSLSLSPSSGVVAAGSTQWLKVELRTDRPRKIEEKALVRLQNHSTVALNVTAEVVNQCLEVADIKGTPLSCLWFGPVYFGTSIVEKMVIKNNAPQACDWVCLIKDNAAGTEVGADLLKSTDAALAERMKKHGSATHDISQVFVCEPKQGRLGPYDKTTVDIRFSPICNRRIDSDNSVNRQDYCVFFLFDSVGSKHGFTHRNANSSVEVAVTGSGLPVSLVVSPSHQFDFPSCVTGQRADLLCVLQNCCPQLPVSFRFRKIAHFTAQPFAATIPPGQSQDVVLTFTPAQLGSFRVRQKIDVLGCVALRRDANTAEDITELGVCSFHTVKLLLFAICQSETKCPPLNLNPGISNPFGFRPHIRCSELARYSGLVRAAVLGADKTQLHKHRRSRSQNPVGEEFLAFPNDRASSHRPSSPHREYRTIFTDVPRYRYVDGSYAFTEEEEKRRQQHRQIYTDFFQQLGQTRLKRIKEREEEISENDVDIGIVPAHGLVPPALHISDLEKCRNGSGFSDSQVMNAVPSTTQEEADCNRTLTAQELYQVDIGKSVILIIPSFVDLGVVCVQRGHVQTLMLVNRLSFHIWVQLEADCPELQGSSPVSHILPPCSRKSLSLTFQSDKLGSFYRGCPLGSGAVYQPAGAPSYPSHVLWIRIQEFVEPYRELDCEVVWHPSFSSPTEGDFDLCVHDGVTQRLHCVAK